MSGNETYYFEHPWVVEVPEFDWDFYGKRNITGWQFDRAFHSEKEARSYVETIQSRFELLRIRKKEEHEFYTPSS